MIAAILGGGASGMMAARTALENGHTVHLFERQARLGKKLMSTGNGRCNLSNRNAAVSHYHGADPAFCAYALGQFGVEATLSYFRTLGLICVEEDEGRIYPFSNSANSVVDTLRLALEQSDCQLHLGCEVQAIERKNGQFLIKTNGEMVSVQKVIVACGGLAGSAQGGTKSGYALLTGLGHTCSRLYPALTQLRTDRTWVKSLKGVRCEAAVTLYEGGRPLAREQGEVQFTDFGISGPCVFSLARACTGKNLRAVLDLCPILTEEEIISHLALRKASFPQLTAENLLTGLLHNRLGRTLVRACGLSLETPLCEISDLSVIAKTVKAFSLPVEGAMDLSQAQVTAGGILTRDFDPKTMESRLVPGLYATGEVLDIDGDCGGYNLQWAWSSGHLAGQLRGSGL